MKRVARGQFWKCPTGFAGLNYSRLAPYRDTVQTMVTTTTMSMSVGSGVRLARREPRCAPGGPRAAPRCDHLIFRRERGGPAPAGADERADEVRDADAGVGRPLESVAKAGQLG